MTVPRDSDAASRLGSEGPTFNVALRQVDADALLALAEWALNHKDLDLGPGLRYGNALDAARRIEAVAAMDRQGVETVGRARYEQDIFRLARQCADLRAALMKAAQRVDDARNRLSPGMRAGTAEACELLTTTKDEIGAALRQDAEANRG